jgi:tetratricopeptide (TPR) repeat protein
MLMVTFFITLALNSWAEDNANSNKVQQLFDNGWSLLSQMHKNKTALDQAIAEYQKVVAIDPENKDVYWKLAEVTFKKGDETQDASDKKKLYQESLSLAQKSVDIDPKSVGGLYWIGCSSARLAEISGIMSALGMVKQAKAALHKCIDIDPDNRFSTLAKTILAAIYSESPWPLRDLTQAGQLAREAATKDPNLTLAALNLAKYYVQNKEYENAKAELKRCLSIKNPTYVWDSELYDLPEVKKILNRIEKW